VNWIQAAQKDGRLVVQNPKWAAKQFMGLINSIAFWPQIISGEPPVSKRDREAIVQSAVAMFLDHYAA
jgi:TetR/AcrR family transcriptional regulator of autoinduction and epiphytic fitness